jgi:trans-aconitate methyltransferase
MRSKSDEVIEIYERHASDWIHGRRLHSFERPFLKTFISLMPARRSVLDIGCGTGEPIDRYLVANGCDVTAIDASPSMIALAKKHFPQLNFTVMDMRKLSIDRKFDGLLAWNSFFHLDQHSQNQMFPIFRKHSQLGTILMFSAGAYLSETFGQLGGESLYHASLDNAQYHSLLEENGFATLTVLNDSVQENWHAVWIARCVK